MEETLTKQQRLSLLNQYAILREIAVLRNDQYDIDTYTEYMTILSYGYVDEYSIFFDDLAEEFKKESSDLVKNILQIYSNMYHSYRKLKNTKLSEKDIIFPGFDGRLETEYLLFCDYLLNDKKLFSEFTQKGRKDFDSHQACCDKYRKMCNKWVDMERPEELTEQQIKDLLSL